MACQPFSALSGKHHEGIPGRNAHEARCLAFKRGAMSGRRFRRSGTQRGVVGQRNIAAQLIPGRA